MSEATLYVLRVKLTWAKGVWREIGIRGDQTLHELHLGILEAFEWSRDDVYAFSLNPDYSYKDKLYTPYAESEAWHSQRVCLDDLSLEEDQTFLYVFGEGERNQFPIRVMLIDRADPHTLYPDVMDENGESPSQDLAYD